MPYEAEDKTEFERALEEIPELTPEMRRELEKAEREQIELARAYNRLFTGIDGEMVFKDLCNLFERRTSLHENMSVTQGNEGKRFVILHIRAMMELAEVAGAGTSSSSESQSE